MNALKKIFSIPPDMDESERQMAQILQAVLIFFGVVSIAYAMMSSLADFEHSGRYVIQGIVLLVCMMLGVVYLHKGYLRLVSLFEILVIWLVFTAAAYTGGGVRSSGYLGYLVVLVVAGILSGKRLDTLIMILLCSGMGYYFVYAEMHGNLPQAQIPITSFAFWLDSLFYFSVVGGLLFITMNVTFSALKRLNLELTERQRTEAALRASEEFRKRVFETSHLPIVIMESTNYQYIDCNPAAVEIYGFASREVTLGKTPLDVSAPVQYDGSPSAEKVHAYIQRALDKGLVVFEWRHQRPNHELWDAEVHLMSFASEDGRKLLQFTLLDITERKLTEAKLVKTANQLAMFNEIGRVVAEVTDLETVLEVIRQQLEKLVAFDFYSVRVFNEPNRTVTHLAVYESGRYWDEPDSPLLPETDAFKVFETGRSILHLLTEEEIEHYKLNPYQQIGDHSSLTASTIFVPLEKHGKTIGVLSVQRYQPNSYTEDDLKLVETAAIQVAIAIENARLFSSLQQELSVRRQAEELTKKVNFELQRRLKELYALNEVAQTGASAKSEYEILDTAVETLYRSLYPDIVGVARWDERAGLLRTFPRAHRGIPDSIDQMTFNLGDGIVGRVASTRQPYRMGAPDDPFYLPIDPKIRSELCVPILAGEKLLGVLDVESKQPEAFSDADENLLLTIAGQLASTLERLRAEQELRSLNAELEQRVIDRTAQLEAANQELEAFSYSVSHDLRAPLRAINGFSKILSDDFAGELSPIARNFLEKIHEAGGKMAQLIDELLDFSRIGRKPLNKQEVEPGVLVRTAIESFTTETASRQIEWTLAEMPSMNVDPVLFQQVYINLIGNALKYSGKREIARIEIGAFLANQQTIYFVRDNGAGFDMQYAAKLFGVFQRLHREDEFEGTGIGLAIVRRIVERHGGRVWAEAEVDKGATFFFSFERASLV